MNKRQKEVQQTFLDNEKKVLKKLEQNYKEALADIDDKIAILLGRDDKDLTNVIYQVEHQKALKTQVQSILEQLQNNEFETVSEYLANAYNDGFIGTMYDIEGQGIPLIVPIDQKQVVEAIQHETKLNNDLYTSMGKDVKKLQKNIASEISRGISTGLGYAEIARNIAFQTNVPKNNAMRIARTEAHRIQCKAALDAQHVAKEHGADVLKQWDSTLDGDTRKSHRKLDGQIRELDERFEVDGKEARFPGDFGDPAEDCNCRCAILQRARYKLDEKELNTLKERAKFFGLDKTKDFEDYKKKYLKAAESSDFKEYRIINEDGTNASIKEKVNFEQLVGKLPVKMKKALNDVDVKLNSSIGSGFKPSENAIYIAANATRSDIMHEFGHAIENKLFDKKKVDALKRKYTEGLTIDDIVEIKAYDSYGNPQNIYILKSNKFIDKYQTRLYIDSKSEGINDDGTINIDALEEFVSVSMQYYSKNKALLKKQFKDLYDLVEDAIL